MVIGPGASLTARTVRVAAMAALLGPSGCGLAESWDQFDRGSGAALGVVQSNYVSVASDANDVSSVQVPFTRTQQAGDVNIVAVGWFDDSVQVTNVSDSAGNVYDTMLGPKVVTGQNAVGQELFLTHGIAASPANTVTVTWTDSTCCPDVRIVEYAGLSATSPVDAYSESSGNGGVVSSGEVTTTLAPDVLFAAGTAYDGFMMEGAGFNRLILTDQDEGIAEDRVVTSTGTYSAGAALAEGGSRSNWVMQLAALH